MRDTMEGGEDRNTGCQPIPVVDMSRAPKPGMEKSRPAETPIGCIWGPIDEHGNLGWVKDTAPGAPRTNEEITVMIEDPSQETPPSLSNVPLTGRLASQSPASSQKVKKNPQAVTTSLSSYIRQVNACQLEMHLRKTDEYPKPPPRPKASKEQLATDRASKDKDWTPVLDRPPF
ncbi:hypothetical protein CYMTET_4691 [Cymbomonas tetramitiformis]|uniref:Uncharacterized protein n=1 Tax=Cymbomonas tetramitiformis TaxID=36881 RepID=A0AAE0H0Q0_9CHLO|nr:hypothetical protein CYMTET_4691 [Cymbomonas tetramitiformis]